MRKKDEAQNQFGGQPKMKIFQKAVWTDKPEAIRKENQKKNPNFQINSEKNQGDSTFKGGTKSGSWTWKQRHEEL